jgi:hypothetical protein
LAILNLKQTFAQGLEINRVVGADGFPDTVLSRNDLKSPGFGIVDVMRFSD